METAAQTYACTGLVYEAKKLQRAVPGHSGGAFKCLLPEVLRHSVFSFIWFFKILAECSPLLLLLPHMDNICLLFTQLAAMCALPKTLLLFVYI